MNIVESIVRQGEFFTEIRLQCGHEVITSNPRVRPGTLYICPKCSEEPIIVPRGAPGSHATATPDQLDNIAREYADIMRAFGFDVPEENIPVLRRAAAIQDAWRCAFARVLGS